MALIHRVKLHPTKLELLAAWLPSRPWYQGPAVPDLTQSGSYRFDDPAGEVGIETILVRAGDGPLLQAPLTYRNAPLDGHQRFLIGTLDHPVLGQRWVYDACGDSVYARMLATTILSGAGQAEELVDFDGRLERRESTASVRGSGDRATDVPVINVVVRVEDHHPTLIRTDSVELGVARILDDTLGPQGGGDQLTLTGTWSGQSTPLFLADVRAL